MSYYNNYKVIVATKSRKCASCEERVEDGGGFAYVGRNDWGGWKTVCGSTACHRDLGVNRAIASFID